MCANDILPIRSLATQVTLYSARTIVSTVEPTFGISLSLTKAGRAYRETGPGLTAKLTLYTILAKCWRATITETSIMPLELGNLQIPRLLRQLARLMIRWGWEAINVDDGCDEGL